ncbi:related to levodione reductase [Melanopsichium pennsylvanicum]|uniref:Related to levodione reductase n=2 Tax=Melanopsichium pennsylvanicum TaxID=63383 RepID=A0AAJ4XFA2_9BASI|nr:related to levodione reductase [Melanopsichium pennsylvanicum 4]SNX81395.1 related to levodione reductase [Melanopsichium pennsylvanicum]
MVQNKEEQQKAAYTATLERLDRIRNHLDKRPRSGRLSGKVAIITGCGSLSGIGRATALQFAHEGVKHIYVCDIDDENLPSLKHTINKRYPDVGCTAIASDAADESSITSIIDQAISDNGHLDIFFANAARATGAPIIATDVEDLETTHHINVTSCFLACKYASAAMLKTHPQHKPESSGSIIMTASVAGLRSGAGSVDYSASKAAVISLAQTTSWQLQRTNVRVNTVCPGLIETGMTMPTFEMARERGTAGKIGQLNPTARYGVAQEIANAVTFLASDEASYVNGVALPVDGGLQASLPVVPGRFH